jgi:pimeloyl-ACP methyl ester carboxylesterase
MMHTNAAEPLSLPRTELVSPIEARDDVLVPVNYLAAYQFQHRVQMTTRILLLTGMTPDDRIYDRLLPRLANASIVPWIAPQPNEALSPYCDRLAATIDRDAPIIICGVSFGGIVARELAPKIKAMCCVIISSVRDPQELPPWFRCFRPFAGRYVSTVLNCAGTFATLFPPPVRTRATSRATKLAGNSGSWHRWATSSVLSWSPQAQGSEVKTVHIHGDRDTTFPIRYTRPDVVIRGGGHVLPLTHDREVARILIGIAGQNDLN